MKIVAFASVFLLALGARAADVRVSIAEGLVDAPVSGRLIIFFVTESGGRWNDVAPVQGPFFSLPQPIASTEIVDLGAGETIEIPSADFATFPSGIHEITSHARVQAVLDIDETERSMIDAPGNLLSDVFELTFVAGEDVGLEINLVSKTSLPELPPETKNLKWVEFRSESLSEFYGRDVFHRAGVYIPDSIAEFDPMARVVWPSIYVIPGYGGTHRSAARLWETIANNDEAPNAVWIVLDPDSPLGHHGFVDSPNHGPRATALITEFIPYLDRSFRLAQEPGARIVTGHSSGGWSSLWLQLQYPEVFGACFSSSPDPVDFRSFQKTNIYEAESVFFMEDGEDTPSMRRAGAMGNEIIAMTVREEAAMEHAMHPLGASGQQWDAWEAMFSPRDDTTGFPTPLFDADTGEIDREVAEAWGRYDIARLVQGDGDRFLPIFRQNVRLACGDADSFYLNEAVTRLKGLIDEERGAAMDGPGYIRLIEGATHGSIQGELYPGWWTEMTDHLREQGWHD
jgi:pimeloyl-ACP methyl ester carboxylesterase